jgi:zinc protease
MHRDRLRKVSVEDVQRVAKYYFKPDNRTVGVFVPTAQPDRAEVPAVPDVAAMMKDYKGDAAVSLGEAFDPSPQNIDARTQRSALPGGLKLALMPKETRGDAVSATLRLQWGDENSLKGTSTAGSLTGAMLMRGTTKHTRQQLQDELDRKAEPANGGPALAEAGNDADAIEHDRTVRRPRYACNSANPLGSGWVSEGTRAPDLQGHKAVAVQE